MKIYIGADHRGLEYKNLLKKWLDEKGHETVDVGTDREESCDYPDYAFPVARAVADGDGDRGILICGSGIGMSIAANRVPGIRGTLCLTEGMARSARSHNNSNVLCVAQDLTDEETLRKILDIWLNTPFDGGRHKRRVSKLDTDTRLA